VRKGVSIAPGVALGRAYCIKSSAPSESLTVDAGSSAAEISRFEKACALAGRELAAVAAQVREQLGEKQAAIFRAHRSLLRDPTFLAKVKATIAEAQVDAGTALDEFLQEYTVLFGKTQNAYLRERLADVRDVIGRVRQHLGGAAQAPAAAENSILVARELLPSQALHYAQLHPAGIVTEAGGASAHAAILIRSLGIPAVSGLPGILNEVRTGDVVALDGGEGLVYVNPGPEVRAALRVQERNYLKLREELEKKAAAEATTSDGAAVRLLANVNGPSDAAAAVRVGAAGVGLYRTEYLFLGHDMPGEEQQVAAYRAVIEAAPNRAVTIRVLDVGSDKQLAFLGNRHEANPALGRRSIRLLSDCPRLFETQLRAILRAGSCENVGRFSKPPRVQILFPMVSRLEEIRRLKEMVAEARASLRKDGLPFGEDVALGIMVEIPATALCLPDLLAEVDFVSIGSNDLAQYLMAADRDNPGVAYLCEPFSPALYRLLQQIIRCCRRQHKPVTLCGEMASRPRCLLPLLGMGLRDFSMSPAFVPSLRELVRRSSLSAAGRVAEAVLHMKTMGEIGEYLARETQRIWPEVALVEAA
jgi:phosphoenolpyruvate-protein phosphotransferase (PTS system enzyme I)